MVAMKRERERERNTKIFDKSVSPRYISSSDKISYRFAELDERIDEWRWRKGYDAISLRLDETFMGCSIRFRRSWRNSRSKVARSSRGRQGRGHPFIVYLNTRA